MNILEYAKNINEYNQRHKTTLAHGMEWKKHKYIRKEGDRYIYPEDINANKMLTSRYGNALNTASNAKIEKQKQEAIAKNAAAAQRGGDAARYANSTGAQRKISEAVAKNAAADQYLKDRTAYEETRKSYKALLYKGNKRTEAENKKLESLATELNEREAMDAKSAWDAYARVNANERLPFVSENFSTHKDFINERQKEQLREVASKRDPEFEEAYSKYKSALSDRYKVLLKVEDYERALRVRPSSEDAKKKLEEAKKEYDKHDKIIKECENYMNNYDYSNIENELDNKYHDNTKKKIAEAVNKNAAAARYGGEAARYAKTTSKSEPEVSDEYKQDVEYNSKKNVYFGKQAKPTVSGSNSVTTWDNANVTTWDDVDSEYEKEKKYNSQKNRW